MYSFCRDPKAITKSSRRLFLGAMLYLLPSLTFAEVPAPFFTDTPAGHAVGSWLDAFNNGDKSSFEAFKIAHAPWLSLDEEMGAELPLAAMNC